MADQNGNFCVKCDENLDQDTREKTLKCNSDTCNKGLHYTCSSYNTTELQFLESNRDNVKWFCDGCKESTVVIALKAATDLFAETFKNIKGRLSQELY